MPSNPVLRVAANLAELANLATRQSQIEHEIIQAVRHVTAAMADLAASFSGTRSQVRAE
jgi:ABC-type transporter Mla subunit MlaD